MSRPMVELGQGVLAGSEKDGVLRFRGIPYAAPPVGAGRLRPPGPAPGWEGVRDARAFGPRAMQNPSPLETALGAEGMPMSEDCLTLNVWTSAVDDGRRPVMVWIHGGGFSGGSAATPWYDGTRFAQAGVVVVTINYRLGSFGFLHLADLAGDGHAGSGNAGILDQVAALEWVRDNIAAFGGDPGNVTVFGESAGAMSVGTLLGLPRARGLFHRAILQSGAAHNVHDRQTATANAERILAGCGLGPDDADRVRDLPASSLLAAQKEVGEELADRGLLFQPVVDGEVVPRPPLETIAEGLNADVPVVIGTTADEWALFELLDPRLASLDEAGLVRRIRRLLGDAAPDVVAAYRAARPELGPGGVFSAIMTDWTFRIPALRLAEAHVAAGGRAYVYEFRWASTAFEGRLRSCHALEIPFVFDVLDKATAQAFTGPGAPRELAVAMNRAWAAFARCGDPGWPAYDTERRATQVFDVGLAVEDDPRPAERLAWEGLR
jgi:para-nitrobenzyl esterase